jgi:cell division inhibitor SepF
MVARARRVQGRGGGRRRRSGMRARAFFDGEATTRVRSLPRPLDFLLVVPLSFNDARRVAQGLRSGSAVLIDLKEADSGLAERLVDFAEGVAAALDCRVGRVAEDLYLVAPRGVSITDSEGGAGTGRPAASAAW